MATSSSSSRRTGGLVQQAKPPVAAPAPIPKPRGEPTPPPKPPSSGGGGGGGPAPPVAAPAPIPKSVGDPSPLPTRSSSTAPIRTTSPVLESIKAGIFAPVKATSKLFLTPTQVEAHVIRPYNFAVVSAKGETITKTTYAPPSQYPEGITGTLTEFKPTKLQRLEMFSEDIAGKVTKSQREGRVVTGVGLAASSFALGAVVETARVGAAVLDPIGTAKSIGYAATHPLETTTAIGLELERIPSRPFAFAGEIAADVGIGYGVGRVVSAAKLTTKVKARAALKVSATPEEISGRVFTGFEQKVTTQKFPFITKTSAVEASGISELIGRTKKTLTPLTEPRLVTLEGKSISGTIIEGVQRTSQTVLIKGKEFTVIRSTLPSGESAAKVLFGDKVVLRAEGVIQPVNTALDLTIGGVERKPAFISEAGEFAKLLQTESTRFGFQQIKTPKPKLFTSGIKETFQLDVSTTAMSDVRVVSPAVVKTGIAELDLLTSSVKTRLTEVDVFKTRLKIGEPKPLDPLIYEQIGGRITVSSPERIYTRQIVKPKIQFSITTQKVKPIITPESVSKFISKPLKTKKGQLGFAELELEKPKITRQIAIEEFKAPRFRTEQIQKLKVFREGLAVKRQSSLSIAAAIRTANALKSIPIQRSIQRTKLLPAQRSIPAQKIILAQRTILQQKLVPAQRLVSIQKLITETRPIPQPIITTQITTRTPTTFIPEPFVLIKLPPELSGGYDSYRRSKRLSRLTQYQSSILAKELRIRTTQKKLRRVKLTGLEIRGIL